MLVTREIAALSAEAKALRMALQTQRGRTQGADALNAPRVVIVRHSSARAAQVALALRDLNAMLVIPNSPGNVRLPDQVDTGVNSTATTRDPSAGRGTLHLVTRARSARRSRTDMDQNAGPHLQPPAEPASTSTEPSLSLGNEETTPGALVHAHRSGAEAHGSGAASQQSAGCAAPAHKGGAGDRAPHLLLRPFTRYNPSALTADQREQLRGLHLRVLRSEGEVAELTDGEAAALATLTANQGRFRTGDRVDRTTMETHLFGSIVKWLIKRTARAHRDLPSTGLELDELRQDVAARIQYLLKAWAEHPLPLSLTTFVDNAVLWSAGALGAQYRNPVEYGGGKTYRQLLFLAARIDTAIEALKASGSTPSDEEIANWINAYGGLKRRVGARTVAGMRKHMAFEAALRPVTEVDLGWRRYDEDDPQAGGATTIPAIDLVSDPDPHVDPFTVLSQRQLATELRHDLEEIQTRPGKVLLLRFGLAPECNGEEFTQDETAAALGISAGTVSKDERQGMRNLCYRRYVLRRSDVWEPFLED